MFSKRIATVGTAVVVCLGLFSLRAAAQDEAIMVSGIAKKPSISVTGRGEISARPDIVEITVGALSHAPTATQAAKDNSAIVARILAALTERGVAEKDVQTTQLRVAPRYNQPNPRQPAENAEFIPRIIGYEVENTVQIVVRKLDQIGAMLDAVLQVGANQVSGIAFRVEHPEKLLDEARKRAMADAKHKATLLAGEAGVVVGPPRSIEEADIQPAPPRYRMGVAMAAPSMPVAPGEEKISVTVSVVYELLIPK